MPKGFAEARDEDYEYLRGWVVTFGMLETPTQENVP